MMNSTFETAKTAFEISLGLTGVLSLWLRNHENRREGRRHQRDCAHPFSGILQIVPRHSEGTSRHGQHFHEHRRQHAGTGQCRHAAGTEGDGAAAGTESEKDTATNPMIMFLVLNTSGPTLIPVSIMVYRAQMGAAQPTDIFIPILLATFFSTLAGIICTSIYQHINLFNRVMLLTLGGMIAVVAAIIWGFGQLDKEQMNVVSTSIANILLMTIIVAFILAGVRKKINVYDAFIEGAKDGSPPPCASSHISWRYSSASAYSVLRAQWICCRRNQMDCCGLWR